MSSNGSVRSPCHTQADISFDNGIIASFLSPGPNHPTGFILIRLASRHGAEHYDKRSDRAFTLSLSCRTISAVLRISGSLRATRARELAKDYLIG
jgi:hypothetical protein